MKTRSLLAVAVCATAFGLTACAVQHGPVPIADTAEVAAPRCNLKLNWNAAANRYEAVYDEPELFASTSDLPRTRYVADQACSVGQILDWQEAVGGGSDVCQFAWRYTSTGMTDVFACVLIERIA